MYNTKTRTTKPIKLTDREYIPYKQKNYIYYKNCVQYKYYLLSQLSGRCYCIQYKDYRSD